MSRTAKKAIEQDAQPQLIFDAKRDINPYWKSSLFSDVYLKNDVPVKYLSLWETDESFSSFYNGFIALCRATKHEKLEKKKEADTVKDWIVLVMDLLGWENNSERMQNSYIDNESFTIEEDGKKQTYRPDLLYFDKPVHKSFIQDQTDYKRKLKEVQNKRSGAKIVVEAKYWDRLSQIKPNSQNEKTEGDSASSMGPELQTLKYMEMLNHDFGILTDGKTWRLFHKELSQGIERRSYDFDLGNLRELALDIESHGNEERLKYYAKYFFHFFSKNSLIETDSDVKPFVHQIFEYSKKYAHSIEEDLKKRFILTMGITCNAIKESCDGLGEDFDLDTIRNVAESHLFNILFVKSCEVRRILPISSTKYLPYSLHEVVETMDVIGFNPSRHWDDYLIDFQRAFSKNSKKFDWDGFEIFNRFINLYEIIHDGTAKTKDFGFEIDGFKESIFSKQEWKFAKKHKISNRNMLEILFYLNFIESKFEGPDFQQIPYSYFTARQLGGIYESFLEYQLEFAETDMIFSKKQWKKANLKSDAVKKLKLLEHHKVAKGRLFFSPDNKDRKMTGAYYTPDHIVKYMVKSTLDPIIENRTAEEIVDLKICDPSMGSGHFLAGVIEYLVGEYRRKWVEENNDDLDEPEAVTTRRILENCIYGVDINPRAVKLAKMSLWLVSAFTGKKLEHLDDQIKCGNSLNENEFLWKEEFPGVFENGGFSTIIGNPPYVFTRGKKFSVEEKKYYKKFFSGQGKINLFSLFFEVSWKLVDERYGKVSFICPNGVLRTTSYTTLRKFILEECGVQQVCVPDHHVFEGVTTEALILVLDRDSDRKKVPVYSLSRELERSEINNVDLDSYTNNIELVFPINVDKKTQKIFDKMNSIGESLEHFTTYILEGIVTTKGKDQFIAKKKVNSKWQKFLEGKDLNRYSIDYQGRFIHYDRDILHRARNEEVFTAPEKVLIQRISGGSYPLKASYDDSQHYTYASINNILFKDEYRDWYLYLTAILNSKLFNYYYGMNFTNFSNLTVNIAGAFLEKLPMVFSDKHKLKIDRNVTKLISKHSEKAEAELNSLIYEIYGLSDAEVKIVNKFYDEVAKIKAKKKLKKEELKLEKAA
jgi:hypothetical protein